MTNCTGHYIGRMTITLMELRLMLAWEYREYVLCRCNRWFSLRDCLRQEPIGRELAIRKSLIRANVNLDDGSDAASRDCNPCGRSAQREQFRIASLSPWRPVCTEVLTNRSCFRIRNGAIYVWLEKGSATRRDARRERSRDVNPASVIHYSR